MSCLGGDILRVLASVIATVKNEGKTIHHLLESLSAQTRQPDEIIIVDGGSCDDTLMQLHEWEGRRQIPLRVISEPGSNISRGRNVAIAAAAGPLIASTDSGVRLDPTWLASLVRPYELVGPAAPIIACGFFAADGTTAFEFAMGATVLPVLADIKPEKFLPSSRSVAFPKRAWETVGGYPEWLDYCEDLVFDLCLQAEGYRFHFVPDAVAHFRPRSSLGAFFRQYYRYARGDGKADLWRKRHLVRYTVYGLAVPLLLWLTWARGWQWAILLLLGAVAMLWTPYRRLIPLLPQLRVVDRVRAILWVPVIRITGDIAKILGYPAGLLWRWKHHRQIPNWRAQKAQPESER